jgi:serine/threonine-protein kinase HipA
MSPLYDVAPVFLLDPRFQSFGHVLDGQTRLRYLSGAHLLREAAGWGLPPSRVQQTVRVVAERVRAALPTVTATVIDVEPVALLVDRRAAAVIESVDAAS